MSNEYVVIDLNEIRGSSNRDFSSVANVVVPHEIVCDILKSPEQKTYQKPFEIFLRLNQQRIVVAHSNGILEGRERAGRALTGNEWIDLETTEYVRSLNLNGEVDWDSLSTSDGYKNHEISRSSFLEFTRDFPDEVRENQVELANYVRSDFNHAVQAIQHPYFGWHFARYFAKVCPTYEESHWRTLLEVFPDTYAIGKWSRLLCWYGFKQIPGPSKDHVNNFEDAAYAFTASYAGCLMTKDKGLKQCVKAIFDRVNFFDP